VSLRGNRDVQLVLQLWRRELSWSSVQQLGDGGEGEGGRVATQWAPVLVVPVIAMSEGVHRHDLMESIERLT